MKETLLVTDLIDADLWNAAEWNSIVWYAGQNSAPGIGLVFRHPNVGEQIFDKLRDRFRGFEDRYNELRISVVRGIPGSEPRYAMNIGSDADAIFARARAESVELRADSVLVASRQLRLLDDNQGTRATWWSEYQKHGGYFMCPVRFEGDAPRAQMNRMIGKRDIHFRTAADIGSNDPDAAVLVP